MKQYIKNFIKKWNACRKFRTTVPMNIRNFKSKRMGCGCTYVKRHTDTYEELDL